MGFGAMLGEGVADALISRFGLWVKANFNPWPQAWNYQLHR